MRGTRHSSAAIDVVLRAKRPIRREFACGDGGCAHDCCIAEKYAPSRSSADVRRKRSDGGGMRSI
jgi:hypothetical protein